MRRKRILLLRSGRHLRVAMDALGQRFPGCRIGVVGTPGSQAAMVQAGIAPEDAFVYPATRFQPLAFAFSRTALAARRWRYDQVAILWNDPDGAGQGNVDRTACAMGPRGYLAITPDGSLIERAAMPQVWTEVVRVLASAAVATALGMLLYLPALFAGLLRTVARRGRAKAAGGPAEAGLYDGRVGAHVESGFSRTSAHVESGFSRTIVVLRVSASLWFVVAMPSPVVNDLPP
jgi:hypothetical protein